MREQGVSEEHLIIYFLLFIYRLASVPSEVRVPPDVSQLVKIGRDDTSVCQYPKFVIDSILKILAGPRGAIASLRNV